MREDECTQHEIHSCASAAYCTQWNSTRSNMYLLSQFKSNHLWRCNMHSNSSFKRQWKTSSWVLLHWWLWLQGHLVQALSTAGTWRVLGLPHQGSRTGMSWRVCSTSWDIQQGVYHSYWWRLLQAFKECDNSISSNIVLSTQMPLVPMEGLLWRNKHHFTFVYYRPAGSLVIVDDW